MMIYFTFIHFHTTRVLLMLKWPSLGRSRGFLLEGDLTVAIRWEGPLGSSALSDFQMGIPPGWHRISQKMHHFHGQLVFKKPTSWRFRPRDPNGLSPYPPRKCGGTGPLCPWTRWGSHVRVIAVCKLEEIFPLRWKKSWLAKQLFLAPVHPVCLDKAISKSLPRRYRVFGVQSH